MAQHKKLDLIEVAPQARPPVCRIGDYGKMKYERKKRQKEAKANQHQAQVKELKVRPKTDDHDMRVRIRRARKFLKQGNKVKITVRFRGREHAHHDIGADQCMRLARSVEKFGKIETRPRMDGRQMHMLLAPRKDAVANAG
jgi:translation initiation factor IF-3